MYNLNSKPELTIDEAAKKVSRKYNLNSKPELLIDEAAKKVSVLRLNEDRRTTPTIHEH